MLPVSPARSGANPSGLQCSGNRLHAGGAVADVASLLVPSYRFHK